MSQTSAPPSPAAAVADSEQLPPPASPGSGLSPRLKRLIGVLLCGLIAASLDTTMVNVAIDKLGRELHSGVSTIQWVSTGYLLSYAIVIPLVGWAMARIGPRRLWTLSLGAFFASSVLCGIAWNVGSLIVFRVLQGAGGGMMLVLFQTVLAQEAGPRLMGKVMSIAALPAMLAPILGPIIGGVIVNGLSWRWIFFVNIPTCAIGLILAWRTLSDARPDTRPSLDRLGLLLLAPGLALLIFGLSEAGSHGSFASADVLGPAVGGLLALVAFVAYALRSTRAPIVNLRLMRVRSYSSGLGVAFIMGFGIYAGLFLLPLFYQQGRGLSALDAGLLLAPQGVGFLIGVLAVNRVTERIGPRATTVIGCLITLVGTIAYTQVAHGAGDVLLAVSLAVRGIGMSGAMIPAISAVYYDIPRENAADASSSQRIVQQVGGSLGTAIVAVILQRQVAGHADHTLVAFGNTFWWNLALSALALIPALLLPARAPGEQAPPSTD